MLDFETIMLESGNKQFFVTCCLLLKLQSAFEWHFYLAMKQITMNFSKRKTFYQLLSSRSSVTV